MMSPDRRRFLQLGASAAALSSLNALAGVNRKSIGHVVVVGSGYGGATIAKYLRLWSEGAVRVTVIERDADFVSCPLSNLVISGDRAMADITLSYSGLQKTWGVSVIKAEAVSIDPDKRFVRLGTGDKIPYDRLVLSPGVDFMYDQIPGLDNAATQARIVHAWKAGPQTVTLRKQLEAMEDGGIFAMTIPKAPYRCPPGPYERASLVAHYFKTRKPKSRVLILDANEDVQSKKALFLQAWGDLYKDHLEYRNNSELNDVDASNKTALLEFERVKADVLNVIPPQRAGTIASRLGLKLVNGRWVDVDWLTMESTSHPGIHVLGDAVFPAPTMPKSGHMANQHAKLAAAAIINLLKGEAPNPSPLVMNTCYSFVAPQQAIHVASVHRYDEASHTLQPIKGAGGLSAARSEAEAKTALGWAQNIWADMLT